MTNACLSQHAAPPLAEETLPMNPSRILIVEDNRALSRVVQVVLAKAGFDVVCAYDGEAAWGLIQTENAFDLIVTDQQMPLLNGVDLCRRIRKMDGPTASIPIFLLTAKGLELDLQQLKSELDITDVIAKPFSPIALVEVLEKHLSIATR